MCIVLVAETLNVKVSYSQLRSNISGDRYLESIPVLSVAHVDDVLEDTLWYQFVWYVDGVPYCKAVNKSYCLLTFSSAGSYSVSVTATVLVNMTTDAGSTLVKRKGRASGHRLLVKGKQVVC